MYKLLLVDDHPIAMNVLPSFLKDGMKDVEISCVSSFETINSILEDSNYRLVIIGNSLSEKTLPEQIENLIKIHPAISVIAFHQKVDQLQNKFFNGKKLEGWQATNLIRNLIERKMDLSAFSGFLPRP